MKVRVQINKQLLTFYASKGRNGGSLTRALRAPIGERIEAAQKTLVNDFLNDEISKEIAAGPGVTNNPSGTLGGYGGLFSFIGFYRDDSPVEKIAAILAKDISFSLKSLGNGKFEITTNAPTKTTLFQESIKLSPIPWNTGRSWLDGIEKGISGLGQYMNSSKELRNPPSLSGRGIQIKTVLRTGKFQNRQYVSKYLKDFERNIKR